ncbi:MAG: rhodanese-related sulfurtransferase [Kiritimatiellia bacterium]|jgi:rhodanese-related sulfurtransferase
MNDQVNSGIQTAGAIFLLVICSVGFGSVANQFRAPKERLPWVYQWTSRIVDKLEEKGIATFTTEEVDEALQTGRYLIVDARTLEKYDAGHIPMADPLPVAEFSNYFLNISVVATPADPLLIYCNGKNCDDSLQLVDLLLQQGYTNLTVYVDGFNAWKAAKKPIEPDPGPSATPEAP